MQDHSEKMRLHLKILKEQDRKESAMLVHCLPLCFLLLPLFLLVEAHSHSHSHSHYDEEEVDDFVGMKDEVTFGSVIKLKHEGSGYFLHSHDINYGSGSGQQSVTAYPDSGDTNSLWQVHAGNELYLGKASKSTKSKNMFKQGKPIECNTIVRLKHLNTKRWLHSHSDHASPVSGRQEVTAYGDPSNSDSGLLCMYNAHARVCVCETMQFVYVLSVLCCVVCACCVCNMDV